ncbi:PI-PLC X domain-containing protein 1 [Plecturocebus cupreus]
MEQLDADVRYLDLRIAHMLDCSEKNLHFVHMVYPTALVGVRPASGGERDGHRDGRFPTFSAVTIVSCCPGWSAVAQSDSHASASCLAGIAGAHHHTLRILLFLVKARFHHVFTLNS